MTHWSVLTFQANCTFCWPLLLCMWAFIAKLNCLNDAGLLSELAAVALMLVAIDMLLCVSDVTSSHWLHIIDEDTCIYNWEMIYKLLLLNSSELWNGCLLLHYWVACSHLYVLWQHIAGRSTCSVLSHFSRMYWIPSFKHERRSLVTNGQLMQWMQGKVTELHTASIYATWQLGMRTHIHIWLSGYALYKGYVLKLSNNVILIWYILEW